MSDSTTQDRAAELLRKLLAERNLSADRVAVSAEVPLPVVHDLLAGRQVLDLAVLERILRSLEIEPQAFFGRLYAPPDGTAPLPSAAEPDLTPSDEPLARQEVEALVADLRGKVRGMVRLLDAEKVRDERG
ncbi:MAG: helix-turn-helix transcriptional regulator [Acidobacteriota bacterium]